MLGARKDKLGESKNNVTCEEPREGIIDQRGRRTKGLTSKRRKISDIYKKNLNS